MSKEGLVSCCPTMLCKRHGVCMYVPCRRDTDGTRRAETACPAPVPKHCQAGAEGIAQEPSMTEETIMSSISREERLNHKGRPMTDRPEPPCEHDYEEVSSPTDMEGETYKCRKCGDRYRLYYEDMQ